MKTYEELITYIKQEQRDDYWETILKNSHLILHKLMTSNQGIVARDLGTTQPQLSTMVKMMRAYQILVNKE